MTTAFKNSWSDLPWKNSTPLWVRLKPNATRVWSHPKKREFFQLILSFVRKRSPVTWLITTARQHQWKTNSKTEQRLPGPLRLSLADSAEEMQQRLRVSSVSFSINCDDNKSMSRPLQTFYNDKAFQSSQREHLTTLTLIHHGRIKCDACDNSGSTGDKYTYDPARLTWN